MTLTITRETNPDSKAQIVREVLADLPDWFGLPDSLTDYVVQSRQLPLWVAREADTIVGFIDLTSTSSATAEIQCMGIKRAFHRRGIGQQLMTVLMEFARQDFQYLQVKPLPQDVIPPTIRPTSSINPWGSSL